MTLIYTRQAQSFLIPDEGLYKRPPPHQLIPFMVKMSGAIRSTPMQHRAGAIKQVQINMDAAWAQIHRAMRPYFFTDFEAVLAEYAGTPVELPDLSEKPNIHMAMHYCLEVVVDLDRLTILLQSDPNAVDAADTIFSCWSGLYRATGRVDGIVRRVESGKGLKGGT
ncbi:MULTISPECIES: hypothetical protein [Pseudomonas]|uniref:hypothetical protein n=1 Tax=Pseudomonas TaxID=286 RepID=UPI00070FCE7D|nr:MULTISPECIES: hypothetical protein [Pseudomonas]KQW19847.1 hypothetical protein ASC85_08340 [Pseudomonas sp. Root401]WHS57432.1 hypothetical protein QLH64_30915 [Pseudomonas brassicacearum]